MTKQIVRDSTGCYHIKQATDRDILDLAANILKERKLKDVDMFTAPSHGKQYLQFKLATLEHEVFTVLFLDNRHRLIDCVEMFNGTIDQSAVYPREVVKKALELNAAALILAHNHPSGVAEPSESDVAITHRLRKALELIEVRVLDHFLVTPDTVVSFAESGKI